MSASKRTTTFVVGIDLGTAFTGYGWGIIPFNSPETNPSWPRSDLSGGYLKAPTSIVLDPTPRHNVIMFGYEAEEFMSHDGNGKNPNYLYFKEFKMALNDLGSGIPSVTSENSSISLKIDLVFGRIIQYIAEQALNVLKYRVSGIDHPTVRDVTWVITVPAIWTPPARTIMLNAATEADKGGLPKENVRVALEPEAAAMTCISCGMFNRAISVGKKYAVIDCGGGTLDIATHIIVKIEDKLGRSLPSFTSPTDIGKISVKEIKPPEGGPYGSNFINKGVIKFLETVFGSVIVSKYKERGMWCDTLNAIEQSKKKCTLESASRPVGGKDQCFYIDLPICDDDSDDHEEWLKEKVLSFNKRNTDHQLIITRNLRLGIPEFYMYREIESIVEKIDKVVRRLITDKSNKIDFVFLVGGFSHCEILSKRIEETVKRAECELKLPPQPGAAIMLGAVFCGIEPVLSSPQTVQRTSSQQKIGTLPTLVISIESRVSHYSYGVSCSEEWNDIIHARCYSRYKTIIEGHEYCMNRYQEFVAINQPLSYNDKPKARTYTPLHENQRNITFSIYYHNKKEGAFVIDEPGVKKIGEITIPVPYMHRPINERGVACEFIFSGTVLKVKVTNPETEEVRTAQINVPLQ